MKLTIKILGIIATATIVVMFLFSFLGISILDKNIREESLRSHKMVYSLFIPSVSRYLWEFDNSGMKDTLNNIISSNYALDVSVYDLEGASVIGMSKDPSGQSIENTDKLKMKITYSTEDLIKIIKQYPVDQDNIIIENLTKKKGLVQLIAVMLHHKKIGEQGSPIGFIVFTYSTQNIIDLFKGTISDAVWLSTLLAIVLILSLGFILQRILIYPIIELSKASLNISMGSFKKIKEKKSDDEMSQLIYHFNKMIDQIQQNQDALRLIADESIKISACVSLNSLSKQLLDSIELIAKSSLNIKLYISTKYLETKKEKDGFLLIYKGNEKIENSDKVIEFDLEYQNNNNNNIRRILIQDNFTGDISSIIDIEHIKEHTEINDPIEESIYNSIKALKMSASYALANIVFIRDQKDQLRRINEKETVRLVQTSLVPEPCFKRVGDFELTSYYESADECAGDWWGSYLLADGRLLLILGDVTGHGTASALVAAVVKGYCDSIPEKGEIKSDEILNRLDSIIRNSSHGERVMTMFSALLDPVTGMIEFSNAAHPFPFAVHFKDKEISIDKLLARGSALGQIQVNKNPQEKNLFPSSMHQLSVGDFIVVFSDGLIECLDEHGNEFGDRRLKKILEGASVQGIENLKQVIINNFKSFSSHDSLKDDVSLVICRYQPIK